MSQLQDFKDDDPAKITTAIEVESPEHAEFLELEAIYQGDMLKKLLVSCAAWTHGEKAPADLAAQGRLACSPTAHPALHAVLH